MKRLAIPVFALLASGFAAPALAQERVLTIFGDDKCPADTICVVAPESERYRIPKPFRERLPGPQSESWAVRQQSVVSNVGKSGTGSCTAVGAGGWHGCWAEYMRQQRAEAEAQKAQRSVP